MMSGIPLRKTDPYAVVPPGFETLDSDWQTSPALVSGGHVFLTGFYGCPMDGPPPADPEAQMRIAFDTVTEVLTAGGLGWRHVVDMTSFHVGLSDHLAQFKAIRSRYVQRPYPTWTALEVAGFAIPGVIVELKVIARLPEAA